MTTMVLKIDDKRQDLVEAFQVFVSNFKGVSCEVLTQETKTEVLSSLSQSLQDIKSGEAVKNARPIEELYKKFAND